MGDGADVVTRGDCDPGKADRSGASIMVGLRRSMETLSIRVLRSTLKIFVWPVEDSEWAIIWSLKWSTMGIMLDKNMCGRL